MLGGLEASRQEPDVLEVSKYACHFAESAPRSTGGALGS